MKLICDSALQLEYSTVKKLDLEVMNYPLYLNGEEYPVSMDMSREEKDKLRLLLKDKKNRVTTSGLKRDELLSTYKKYGDSKIIALHQSGKASIATLQTISQIVTEHPELDITFIDAHHLTSAYSVIVQQTAEAMIDGKKYDELVEYIEKIRGNTFHLGTVYDLFYLHRTGRISLAKAVLGSAMKFIALLSSTDDPGVLKSTGKVKNAKQANSKFVKLIQEQFEQMDGNHIRAVISVIGPHEEEAADLKERLESLDIPIKIEIHYTNFSNMPHAGPDFYDIGYTIHN